MAKPKSQPPKLKSPLRSFLENELSKRAEAEGGFLNLAGAITTAYQAQLVNVKDFEKTYVIHRAKLSELAHGSRDLRLSIEELEALHCYLGQFGLGLDRKPLFSSSTVLQDLAVSRSATFLLGSNMSHEGAYVSHFDMLAMVEIQRALNRLGSPLRLDTFDVHGTTPRSGQPARPWKRVFGRHGPSAICIGSPRANQASEQALCALLEVGKGPTPWARLPFYFVWDQKGSINQEASRLARGVEEVEADHPALAKHLRAGRGWGLVVGDQVFCSDHVTEKSDGQHKLRQSVCSHAVIAAQRQPEGQIWAVAAGLNGTGTYLAAANLPKMRGTLPRSEDPCPQAVLWCVVEGQVDTSAMLGRGQLPAPSETRFVVEPSLWDPGRRQPVT